MTISSSPSTLVAETWNFGDRTPSDLADMWPSVLFDSQQRTLCATAMPWDANFVSHGGLIYYDKYGLYPAHIETTNKMGGTDRHLYPALGENNAGEIITAQEVTHIGQLRTYKLPADLSKSEFAENLSGLCSRINVYKLATGFAIVHQYNDNDIYVTTCDENGQNFTAARILINGATGGIRIYPNPIYGTYKATNGWYYMTFDPRNTSAPFTATSWLLKTQDFVTFYNYTGSHSFTSTTLAGTTPTVLNANGYIAASNGGAEISTNPWTIDREGNIYRIEYPGTGSNIITTYWNGSAWTRRTSTSTHTFNAPFGSVWLRWACKRGNTLYVIGSINNGSSKSKPHMLKSTDFGVNWTDMGDLLPSIADAVGYYRMQGPANCNEIPDNTNFTFYASEGVFDDVTARQADMYWMKATFGTTIQADQTRPAASTLTALSDITGARYIYETDNMSGTNFVDKSSAGRTVTSVGTPTLTSGEQIYSGTTQANVPANTSMDDNQVTLYYVGRPLGTNALKYWHMWSQNTVSTRFSGVGSQASAGTLVRSSINSGTTDTFQAWGVTNINDGNFHIVKVVIDGKHSRIYLDGKEENKVYDFSVGDLLSNGNWTDDYSDNVNRIAGLDRTSDTYYNIGLKALAHWPRVLTVAEQRSIEKFLSTKYSITLNW